MNPFTLEEVKIIEPEVFKDERGFFFESFNLKRFEKIIGSKVLFVQDNHSKSNYGVLRGLHYQLPPFEQGKLLRVISGEIFDVAIDIRKSSPNFGKWIGINISAVNKKQIWIPKGFAHGFLTLSEFAEVQYKTTDYWSKKHERIINWRDPSIDINWPDLTISNLGLMAGSYSSVSRFNAFIIVLPLASFFLVFS